MGALLHFAVEQFPLFFEATYAPLVEQPDGEREKQESQQGEPARLIEIGSDDDTKFCDGFFRNAVARSVLHL